MTKSRLPMLNLRENNWSKVQRVTDKPIASTIIRYKIMRSTENNEFSYLKGQFIYREYLKDQCYEAVNSILSSIYSSKEIGSNYQVEIIIYSGPLK